LHTAEAAHWEEMVFDLHIRIDRPRLCTRDPQKETTDQQRSASREDGEREVTSMNESKELLTTTQKARTINFDGPLYGTFAEIGAGQEVAREFFHAGGASGTIAKSISAYDMVFSDAIYGKAPRYVSRERLKLMLDHEYDLLIERLSATRGDKTKFFVFADTVATINFKGTNEAHGWLGIRFQTEPMGEPSEIVLHETFERVARAADNPCIDAPRVRIDQVKRHDAKFSPARNIASAACSGSNAPRRCGRD
jgi:hypothetical protein